MMLLICGQAQCSVSHGSRRSGLERPDIMRNYGVREISLLDSMHSAR